MRRRSVALVLGISMFLAASAAAAGVAGWAGGSVRPAVAVKRCPRGAVPARVAGKRACLKAGQRCKHRLERQYRRYGFHCAASGRLARRKAPRPGPRAIDLNVTGPAELVFDWTTQRCEDLDIPDLPARAFRTADGQAHLISAHFVNRQFVGQDLDHLGHPCSVVLESDFNPDPAAFDDYEWIASTYTTDGTTVYALVHDEYHGWEHPGECAATSYTAACWYNAITLAVSTDAGQTYVDRTAPRLVASVPYPYVPNTGPDGIFTPSNIVHDDRDGYYYALAYVDRRDSYIGNCVMRTKNLADASSWRAWKHGFPFTMSFVDPYGPNPSPTDHLCNPPSSSEPRDLQPGSLTYNSVARQWLLVGQAFDGAYYSLSTDLISWRPPKLLFHAQTTWNYKCGDPDPIAYPSLIDPSSTSLNFDRSGKTAYLYFTQFHYAGCMQTLDRDLVRVPVSVKPA